MNNSIDASEQRFLYFQWNFNDFLDFYEFMISKMQENTSKINVFSITPSMTGSTFVEIRNAFQCFVKASRIHYFKNARKPQDFTCFFNNSSHVTEHFLHTSNEIFTFLTDTSKNLRKYNDFIRNCQYFLCFLLIFHGFRVQEA